MFKTRKIFITLILIFFILHGSTASVVTELYESQVKVSDRSEEALQQGLKTALKNVLVKLTGSKTYLNDDNSVETLIDGAESFVEQYSLTSAKNNENLKLNVKFDQVNLMSELLTLEVPIWEKERPDTYVGVIVVDEEKRIVAPFNESTNFEFLSFTAKQRGLPIIYPKSYDRDLLRTIEIDGTLGPSDHLRGVAELIASKYQLASILLAHIRKINFDIWQINWFLRVDDKSFSGTFVDGFLPLSLSELLDQAVDKIAVNLVRSPMDDLKENVKVLVDKVVDLDDYMGLIEFLEKLDVVEKVVVNSIDETQVMLTVTARRGEKNLKQSIEFGNYIRKVSDNPLTYDYQ